MAALRALSLSAFDSGSGIPSIRHTSTQAQHMATFGSADRMVAAT